MTTVWAANVLPLQAPFCYWQFWWEIRDRKIRGECDCRANARFHNPDNLRIKTIHVYPRSLRRENGYLTIHSHVILLFCSFSAQDFPGNQVIWFSISGSPPSCQRPTSSSMEGTNNYSWDPFSSLSQIWSPCIKTKNNPKNRPSTAVWLLHTLHPLP